jgi:sterol 24-C-methyltransferase
MLAEKLGLQKGHRVVDIGCGVGGPAMEIARNANVSVVGVNISEYQLQRATRYTAEADLQSQVTFHRADFMQTRLKSESFDAAYSIEGTSYAPTLQGVYSEIFRILKPGGTFAAYELILTDIYDNNNPEHRSIRHSLEEGMGITNLSTMSEAIEAIKAAGFQLMSAEDLANGPGQIPWYYLLTGSLRVINSIWDIRRLMHMAFLRSDVARFVAGAFESAGILPPGSQRIIDTLAKVGDVLVKAGDKKLFTPLFLIVGKKPSAERPKALFS